MVSMPGCVFIKVPEVNSATRTAIMFGNNHHAVLPSCRVVDWDPLKHTQPTVPIQAFLDSQLPVEGDLGWNMYSHRLDLRVKVELEGWAAFHEGELLLLTTVKRRRPISLHYPIFQFGEVFLCCLEGEDRRMGWGKGSDRT